VITMNADIFAEWFRRQGCRVVRTTSSFWYEASPRVFQAFPYHWLIQPLEDEVSQFLRHHGAIGLRYSAPVDSRAGRISYHAIYDQPDYSLGGLDRRSRQNIRKGLRNCTVEPISFECLAEEGWLLEKDTEDRQGRQMALSKESWQRRCLSAADLPGFEAWGALVDGRLVASLLTVQVEDWCEMISQQCRRDYLSARVNNALCFFVTQTIVKRASVGSIFYTLQSLDAPPSVDEFKFRMGYKARPVRQRVVFHPWLSPVFTRISHAAVKRLLSRYPDQPTLAKTEGMLRFYLEGSRPLQEQTWPECLTPCMPDLVQ
jgi:hypothetical protein